MRAKNKYQSWGQKEKQFILDLGDGVPTPSPGKKTSSTKEEKPFTDFGALFLLTII